MAYSGLAATTFMAGPDDAQAAADAFASGSSNAIFVDDVDYKLISATSPVGVKIKPPSISEISLGKTEVSPFKISSDLPLNSAFSPISDYDRIKTGVSSIKNCIGGLDSIAKSLLKVPNDLVKSVVGIINGVPNILKNLTNGFGNLNGITCITNTLTNGQYKIDIKDKGALSALISGATNQGSSMGINNIFSSISKVVTDKDILLSACKNILPTIKGNFNLLKDLSQTSIGNNLKSIVPNLASNSINSFRIPSGTSNFQLPSIFSDMKSTLSTIDSNWNKVSRNNIETLFGGSLTNLSASDFHDTMSCSVMNTYVPLPTPSLYPNDPIVMPVYQTDEQFLMITKDIGKQSVSYCLATDLPNVPINIDPIIENTSAVPVDNISSITNSDSYDINNLTTYESDNKVVTKTKSFPDGSSQITVTKYNSDGTTIDPYTGSTISKITKDSNQVNPIISNPKGIPPGTLPEGTHLGTSVEVIGLNKIITEKFQGSVEPPYTSQWITVVTTTTDSTGKILSKVTESELI